jgi:signal transduction histidine kinase
MDNKPNEVSVKKYTLEQLQILADLSSSIARKDSKDKLVQDSINTTAKLMNFFGIIVFFKDPNEEMLRFGYFSENILKLNASKLLNFAKLGNKFDIPMSNVENAFVSCIVNNKPFISDNFISVSKGILTKQIVDILQFTSKTRDVYVTPLKSNDEIIGSICFCNLFEAVPFSESGEFLEIYAKQLANTIKVLTLFNEEYEEKVKLQEEIRDQILKLQTGTGTNFTNADQTDDSRKQLINELDEAVNLFKANLDNPFSQKETIDIEQLKQMMSQVTKAQLSLYKYFGIDSALIEEKNKNKEFSLYPIKEIIEFVFNEYKQKALDKGLVFTLKINDDVLNQQLLLNKPSMTTAISHVVDNAIKYTEKGTVSINVYRTPNFIEISVKDTGVGIPQDKQTKLFEITPTITNLADMKNKTTGVSLYHTKDILTKHKGGIVVESEVGKGTTVVILLSINEGK